MPIKPGKYHLGETVKITGNFFDMVASSITLTMLRPPPDSQIMGPIPVTFIEEDVLLNFIPDLIGVWKVRLECQTPKHALTEAKFEIVPPPK